MPSPSKVENPLPSEAECLEALYGELEKWGESKPRLFLRDDDAFDATEALEKLISPCEDFNVPLLLATIPKPATRQLAERIRTTSLVTGAVHGYCHKNHSPKGEKTCELGRHRPLEEVLGELREGRAKLLDLFDGKLSDLLVPPWNRIHDEIIAEIEQLGFRGLSADGWLKQPMPVKTVNAHVDIMHWSGGKISREHNWVLDKLTVNLEIARQKGNRAVGILSHHLAHDDKAWAMLRKLFKLLNDKVEWVAADILIDEAEEPI